MEVIEAHWRDSARSPKFFMIDAWSALPLLLMFLHLRLWTFVLALLTMAFFGILERFNFTLPIFLRWFRNLIAGPVKFANTWWRD